MAQETPPRKTLALWPRLVAEWHPRRNPGLQPDAIAYGSARKVWWKCARGPDHEWQASPNNRTSGATGCPFCAGRRASLTNSLATVRPDLAQQWHHERNGDLSPRDIVASTTLPVWWQCPAASAHEWRASPRDRQHGPSACPLCRGLRAAPALPRRGLPSRAELTALREDHRRIAQIFSLLEPGAGGEREVQALLGHIRTHLAIGADVLHPLLHGALESTRQRLRELQAAVHAQLLRVGARSVVSHESGRAPTFALVRELRVRFEAHARFEEDVALPALESLVSPSGLEGPAAGLCHPRITAT